MGAVLPGQLSGVISRGWKGSALVTLSCVFEPCNCIDEQSFGIFWQERGTMTEEISRRETVAEMLRVSKVPVRAIDI